MLSSVLFREFPSDYNLFLLKFQDRLIGRDLFQVNSKPFLTQLIQGLLQSILKKFFFFAIVLNFELISEFRITNYHNLGLLLHKYFCLFLLNKMLLLLLRLELGQLQFPLLLKVLCSLESYLSNGRGIRGQVLSLSLAIFSSMYE